MVQEAVELKQQLLVHCVGDRSAEVVLQALENHGPATSWPARRMRIEHGDGVVADLLPRAKRPGVGPTWAETIKPHLEPGWNTSAIFQYICRGLAQV